jgi:hypothetical protein
VVSRLAAERQILSAAEWRCAATASRKTSDDVAPGRSTLRRALSHTRTGAPN